jgi:hypothetical protein
MQSNGYIGLKRIKMKYSRRILMYTSKTKFYLDHLRNMEDETCGPIDEQVDKQTRTSREFI